MRVRGLYSAILVIFALCFQGLSVLAADNNPWRELDPQLREALQRLLRKDGSAADADFQNWYRKWYCPDKPAEACTVDSETYPEFFFNHRTSLAFRVSYACVVSKIKNQAPELLETGSGLKNLELAGTSAAIGFSVENEQRLRDKLSALGFTAAYGADFGREWGLRSKYAGAELHWGRDKNQNYINVHIDLNNPGIQGDSPAEQVNSVVGGGELVQSVKHVVHDLIDREENYSPAQVIAAMGPKACGLGRSDLLLAAAQAADEMLKTALAFNSPDFGSPPMACAP